MKTGVYILQFIPPGGGGRNMIFSSLGEKTWHLKEKKFFKLSVFLKEKGENIEFKPLTAVLHG